MISDGYEPVRTLLSTDKYDLIIAKNRSENNYYIVKMLKSGSETDISSLVEKRLSKELGFSTSLEHPNIASPLMTFSNDNVKSIIYKYGGGETLSSLIQANKPPEINDVINILIQLLDALEYLHSRGIILCNLSPDTILIEKNKGIELIDFGTAIFEDSVDTLHDGLVIGYFPYLSPEQTGFTEFKVDTRSDLYCAGLILYQLLSGFLPFKANTGKMEELLNLMLKTEIEPIRDIPVVLNEILLKALRPTPIERYQTATGFKYDLKNAALGFVNEINISFKVGEKDAVYAVNRNRLFISRDHEMKLLESGLHLCQRGSFPSYLLVGVSGIGKTELVNRFKKKFQFQIKFVTVKCNRLTPNQPYYVLHQILQSVLHLLESFDTKKIDIIKTDLRKKIHDDASVVCKIFPEVRLFFNQTAVAGLVEKDKEADQIIYVMTIILETLLNNVSLVLCIDDLQWIDRTSFNILMKLRSNGSKCMCVFTYRIETEHNKPHIYNTQIENITDRLVNITPFRPDDVKNYLAAAFDNIEECSLLSNTLTEKSNGNPLVLRSIVDFLVDNGIISRNDNTWAVDLKKIDDLPSKFDPVSLIIHKFSALTNAEQFYLQLCSLFNGALNKSIIDLIGGFDLKESNEILQKLVLDGFIVRNGNGVYSFFHDKVQEAILTNIDPFKKSIFYERLAEEYVKLIDSDKNYVYSAAECYLKTTNLHKSFQYSFQAAQFAVEKVAFDVAVKHFRNCLFISEQMKKKGYAAPVTQTEIEVGLGDVLVLIGRNEQAFEIYKRVLEKGDLKDEFSALQIKYKIGCVYHNTGNFEQSVPFFIEMLEGIGFKFPTQKSNSIVLMMTELIIHMVKSLFRLMIFQKRNKPIELLKARILNKLSYSLYFNDMTSCLYPHLKALNLTNNFNDNFEKAETFALHASPSYQLFFTKRAFRYLQKAIKIAEKINRRDILAFSESICSVLYYFKANWQKSEKFLKSSIKNFQSIGDNSNQIIGMEHLWKIMIAKGDIVTANNQILSTIKKCHEINEQHFLLSAKAAEYYVSILMGKNSDLKKLEEIDQSLKVTKSTVLQSQVSIYLISADFLQNNMESALKRMNDLLPVVTKNFNSEYIVPLLGLYAELLINKLLNSNEKNKTEKRKIRSAFIKYWLKITFSSFIYPAYRGNIWRLIAWFFYSSNKNLLAGFAFQKSIKSFHLLDMKYEKAKSLRDYGVFLSETNSPGFARDKFDAAYNLFKLCGAVYEIKNLKEKFSSYIIRSIVEPAENVPLQYSKENSNQLRFDTLLEVSSSMSQINELPVLLEQILSSLINATGAQYGCLLLKNNKGEMQKTLLQDFNGKELSLNDIVISQSIVEKTEYQKEYVLVRGSPTDIFKDVQNVNMHLRSVLCMPLYRDNHYMGCVYLGNDKVAGLFSENAVKTAQILSAQASILLENAFLMQKYIQLNQELDNKIKQQTRDIVEKNRQLELTNLKLVESERMKGILSGTLVHDIKNYAAGIEGNLQYLSRRLTSDVKIRRILDVVGETCTDIVSLASNLLDIAKMDEGKLVVHTERLTSEFIESMAEKFLKNPLFEEKEIVPVIKPTLDSFSINADIYLLERVFQNIFSNAAKYVPRNGKVELSFYCLDDIAMICFYNSGIPIPEKEKDILFEKYARLENRQSQYSKGLGLFFCKMVMNAHKGKIWLETDENGNYFKLSFNRVISSQIQNTGT